MKKMIAYCGLDCEKCDAYIATVTGDDALREKTAKLWSEMNGVTILPEQINCEGCRADGVKSVYCDSLCGIRKCALQKGVDTCGGCAEICGCEKAGAILSNNSAALRNLADGGEPTQIETERLIITLTTKKQMEIIISLEKDGGLKAAYTEMLDGCLSHPDKWAWYAIWTLERKDGICVGDLSFKGLGEDGAVEIGYGVKDDFTGQGYATEAVNAAVKWALRQRGVVRVEAQTDPDNKASQRVLEKCGFVPTGTNGDEGPLFVKER